MTALWKYRDYRNGEGAQALSLEIHISDMTTTGDAFPSTLRAQANRHAEQVSEALAEMAWEQKWDDEQVTGSRLDTHKRREVGRAMRQGEVDVNVLRPYLRMSEQPKRPTVAIVASAGNVELHSNTKYVEEIAQVVIALSWACEMVGIDVWASLNADHCGLYSKQAYREAQIVYWLAQPGRTTPLQHYATTLGRNRFLWEGFPSAWERDEQARKRFANLQGLRQVDWGSAYSSRNGGKAVHWARSVLQADLVIAFGNLTDKQSADVHVQSQHYDIGKTLETTLKELRKLRIS